MNTYELGLQSLQSITRMTRNSNFPIVYQFTNRPPLFRSENIDWRSTGITMGVYFGAPALAFALGGWKVGLPIIGLALASEWIAPHLGFFAK